MFCMKTATTTMHEVIINRVSESYQRFTAAGFAIDGGHMYEKITYDVGAWRVYTAVIFFTCVCGKKEVAVFSIDSHYLNIIVDAAWHILNSPALSEEHLRDDGYSEEQIKKIRQACNLA